MSDHSDITLEDTIDIKFTTAVGGVPTTLAGSPVISAYVGNSATELTAGITLSVDFDSRTGLNNVRVVATAANGYTTATNVQLVVTVGTIGGVSAVGYVVGSFSIGNRSAFGRLGAAGAGLTDLGGMSTAMKAEVNAEADTALTDYDGPTSAEFNARTLVAASYFDPAVDTVATVTTVTNQLTAAAIADAIWDEAVAGHVGAGTFGKTDADILADTNELQSDDVPGLIAALNDPTAATIADAVWDEAVAGHVGAGTFGKTDADILADTNELQGDDVPGLIATAQADLDTITGATGVNLLAATQASIDAIETDTGTTLQAELDGIQADTEDLQTQIGTAGAGLTALPWNAAWDAEVESEVNDALDTAISELGVAAPTATPTIRTGLMLLYMALRNKAVVQTSGTDAIELYNNAGTKIAAKLITDDGSDYTEAEMA